MIERAFADWLYVEAIPVHAYCNTESFVVRVYILQRLDTVCMIVKKKQSRQSMEHFPRQAQFSRNGLAFDSVVIGRGCLLQRINTMMRRIGWMNESIDFIARSLRQLGVGVYNNV